MSYEHRWYLKPHIYYIRYWGEVTLEDAAQAGDDALTILEASTEKVHIIFSVDGITSLPDIRGRTNTPRSRNYYTHPNLGWTIYIGSKNNPSVQFVISIIAQNHQGRFRWVYSEIEAQSFLHEVDEKLIFEQKES